jgi:hypothetical protein
METVPNEEQKPPDEEPIDDEHDEMIEPDADRLDTEVEDADLYVGEGDDEPS